MTTLYAPASTLSYQHRSLSTSFPKRSSVSEARASGLYSADLPGNLAIDPRIKAFYEAFYDMADHSNAHEAFAERFYTKDATFIMGSRTAKGHNEICEMRRGMWSGPIVSRQHTLHRIFPFGNHSHDIMMHGACTYYHRNGQAISLDWAATVTFHDDGNNLKMKFYQVYVDSAVLANATKDG